MWLKTIKLSNISIKELLFLYIEYIRFLMPTNEELEKRIEILEKEVQHLKAVLQYQMRIKKKWLIYISQQSLKVLYAYYSSTFLYIKNLISPYKIIKVFL